LGRDFKAEQVQERRVVFVLWGFISLRSRVIAKGYSFNNWRGTKANVSWQKIQPMFLNYFSALTLPYGGTGNVTFSAKAGIVSISPGGVIIGIARIPEGGQVTVAAVAVVFSTLCASAVFVLLTNATVAFHSGAVILKN
jgi:hypothetical protein